MTQDSVSGTEPTPSGHGPGEAARAQLARDHRLLIDGEWREAGQCRGPALHAARHAGEVP